MPERNKLRTGKTETELNVLEKMAAPIDNRRIRIPVGTPRQTVGAHQFFK